MPFCQPRGKNDESVPNSSREGSTTPSALRKTPSSDWPPSNRIQLLELEVSKWMVGHWSAAIRASRKKPAPKCGTITGTCGKPSAIRASASGSPRRRSKRLGSPSFFRTPTVSTPQCTNTAAPCAAAAGLRREQLKETGREEVAVGVVDHVRARGARREARTSGSLQPHDFHICPAVVHGHSCHAWLQVETSGPRRTRIDYEAARRSLDEGSMRVAEHDDIGSVARQQSCGCRTADF